MLSGLRSSRHVSDRGRRWACVQLCGRGLWVVALLEWFGCIDAGARAACRNEAVGCRGATRCVACSPGVLRVPPLEWAAVAGPRRVGWSFGRAWAVSKRTRIERGLRARYSAENPARGRYVELIPLLLVRASSRCGASSVVRLAFPRSVVCCGTVARRLDLTNAGADNANM